VPVPDKKVGTEKHSKVHLWVVPAKVDGLWCPHRLLGPGALELAQKHQEVQGKLTRRGQLREGTGRLVGNLLHLQTRGDRALDLEVVGDTLRAADRTDYPALNGATMFTRARGGSC
jgi:hypothetical protein